ncbi:unnamed protein product, partial [Urochloa humidicola]
TSSRPPSRPARSNPFPPFSLSSSLPSPDPDPFQLRRRSRGRGRGPLLEHGARGGAPPAAPAAGPRTGGAAASGGCLLLHDVDRRGSRSAGRVPRASARAPAASAAVPDLQRRCYLRPRAPPLLASPPAPSVPVADLQRHRPEPRPRPRTPSPRRPPVPSVVATTASSPPAPFVPILDLLPRAVPTLLERHWARPHTLSWCQRRRMSCGTRTTSLLLGTISKLQAVTVRLTFYCLHLRVADISADWLWCHQMCWSQIADKCSKLNPFLVSLSTHISQNRSRDFHIFSFL